MEIVQFVGRLILHVCGSCCGGLEVGPILVRSFGCARTFWVMLRFLLIQMVAERR